MCLHLLLLSYVIPFPAHPCNPFITSETCFPKQPQGTALFPGAAVYLRAQSFQGSVKVNKLLLNCFVRFRKTYKDRDLIAYHLGNPLSDIFCLLRTSGLCIFFKELCQMQNNVDMILD